MKKTMVMNSLLLIIAAIILEGCGGDQTSPSSSSTGATACTYTPYSGAAKQCINVSSSTYCTKYSYSTIGDENFYSYSTCANLGY